MLKDRVELENLLNQKKTLYNKRQKKVTELAIRVYERFKIPTGEFVDLISGRKDLSEASEFYLFCMIYMIDLLEETLDHKEFFTDREISLYLQSEVQDELKDFFPIVFDCTQTAPDQWVGSTNVSFLMKLRRLQLVRYNPETQRTMNKVVRGDKEVFKIAIDKLTAERIAQSFEDETYIPDTITLNILPDCDADFYYDAKKKELVINSIDHFDMIDGFHRYFAMGFIEDKRENFEYPMELRITNFSTTKAKQFIWQQDQKTKMRRIDSESMNMNNPAVVLLETLNQDVISPTKGMFKRNGGQVNIGEFAKILDFFFFRDKPKSKHRAEIIKVKKFVNNMFDRLFEYDTNYAEKTYSFMELLYLTRAFDKYNDLKTEEVVSIVTVSMRNTPKVLYGKVNAKRLFKPIVSNIDELMEEAYEQRS